MNITEENYRELSPSQFVREVYISAINKAVEMYKPIDLGEWRENKNYLPCPGGMACINMGLSVGEGFGDSVSSLGDAIRIGNGGYITRILNALFGVHIEDIPNKEPFEGDEGIIRSRPEFQELRNRYHFYANWLEKAGY